MKHTYIEEVWLIARGRGGGGGGMRNQMFVVSGFLGLGYSHVQARKPTRVHAIMFAYNQPCSEVELESFSGPFRESHSRICALDP